MRSTHTYATLKVSQRTYDEIRSSLEAAGYQHAFMGNGAIDMHGIALVPVVEALPIESEATICCMLVTNPGDGERPRGWQQRVNNLIRAQSGIIRAFIAKAGESEK